MTTTLSTRGQVVIPQAVRERCGFREGDHFVVEDSPDQQVVTLRKVKPPASWFEVYMECPYPFQLPPRRRRLYRRKHELAG